MTWALLCSMALAGGLPEVPAPLADECPRSYPLSWVADIELLKVQRAELRGTIEDGQSPWVYRAQGAGVIGAVSLALWVGWYTGFNAGAIQ